MPVSEKFIDAMERTGRLPAGIRVEWDHGRMIYRLSLKGRVMCLTAGFLATRSNAEIETTIWQTLVPLGDEAWRTRPEVPGFGKQVSRRLK